MPKRLPHSKPGSVDQELEDSFPASDPPSFAPGAIGAPAGRETKKLHGNSPAVKAAQKKLKSPAAKKPETY